MPPLFRRLSLTLLLMALAALGAPAAAQEALARAPSGSAPMDMRLGSGRSLDAASGSTDVRAAGSAPAVSLALPLAKDYRVGPNDLIDIEVLDADNLKRSVRVNGAGYITLPLLGHQLIAGMTPQELEQHLARLYGEKYLQNPQVSVFVREFAADRITIEGAVGRPGIYPLTGQFTLLRALAVAGGFAQIADSSKVMVYRTNANQKREALVFDVDKIRAGQAEDPRIYGDDMIVVQRDSMRVLLKDSLIRDVIDSINPFSVLVPR